MKFRVLIIAFALTSISAAFGAVVFYDFQNVPVGPLPGGFLSLDVDGVNAFFSANGTTVDVNPVTGTHVLHTGNYHGQMGLQFSSPFNQVALGVDGILPSTDHHLSIAGYYTPDGTIHGFAIPLAQTAGSTLIFDRPRNVPRISGILLDGNIGNGFALDYVSVQLVPEPAATLFILGAAMVLVQRRKKLKDYPVCR